MSETALLQLRDLAANDEVLQLALAAAANTADLQAIASQRGLELSELEAQQWLDAAAPMTEALSPEELAAISEGLSLTDEDLAAVSGGQTGGESIVGQAGEALF